MELPTQLLVTYGYLVIFGWVLIEQLGLPLPAVPVLMAAGALSASGQLNLALVFVSAVVAALIADITWFFIGRRYGHIVFNLLCRMSMEPTTCVRKTQASFGRNRGVMLIFAKFVPGLSTVAPPVAGRNGMRALHFLYYDALGSILWVGSLMAAGRFFADALTRYAPLFQWVARFSGALLAVGIAAFLAARLVRRMMILKELAASRIEPQELKSWIDGGEEVFIVDLRHPLEVASDPVTVAGARHFAPDSLSSRRDEIPRDREVILFCSCPSEATAAQTARKLHRLGLERVRPLRGGLDAWRELGYPVDTIEGLKPQLVAIGN